MSSLGTLIAGVLLGAGSWGLGSLLSGRFEPFDSLTGFLTTQVVLGGAAALAGYRGGGARLAMVVLGGYLGLNLYPFAFGGPESRAWAPLGAVTTLALIALPIVAGAVGVGIRRMRARSRSAGGMP